LLATAIDLLIRDLQPDDWTEVAAIYRDGMRGGMATFETEVPPWEAWHEAHSIRVVAELDERVIGWAACGPASTRWAYRGVAESSVYIARDQQRRRVGRALLERLIEKSESAGIWTLQTAIFPRTRHRCGCTTASASASSVSAGASRSATACGATRSDGTTERGDSVIKVEAVVIRERVETVIDASRGGDRARWRNRDRGSRPRPAARDHA
jgi:phosphinothricin acetyltransferase